MSPPTASRSVRRSPRPTEPRPESKGSLPSTTTAAPDVHPPPPRPVVPKEPDGDSWSIVRCASQRAAGSGVVAEVSRFPWEGDGLAALAAHLLRFEKRLSAMSELLTESRSGGRWQPACLGQKERQLESSPSPPCPDLTMAAEHVCGDARRVYACTYVTQRSLFI